MNLIEAEKELTRKLRTIHSDGEASSMSDWVMEYLTGSKRAERISSRQGQMTEEQQKKYDEILSRLLRQEPLQYILQQAWFCGFKFYVDQSVLIPRPETEELVEWIISNCRFPVDELCILDVGTGSGCIPIALKRRIRKAEVWSCDKSKAALAVARKNAETLGTPVHFLDLDFLDTDLWTQLPAVDILVSNPPYIPEKDATTLDPNVREFEPGIALFVPDNDALVFYRALAAFGKIKLKSSGSLYAEIHEDHGEAVLELFRKEGYQCALKKDMQGKQRLLKCEFPGHG